MSAVKIGDIAEIYTGFTARGKVAVKSQGHLLVQLKDITNDGSINIAELDRSPEDEFKDTHLIAEGDLVFRSRGQLLTVGVVPELSDPVAIVSPLMKICVDRTKVLPEYLCWVINNTPGQSYFATQAAGSALRMISKSALSDMEIILPSIEEQKTIAELSALQKKEAGLCAILSKKTEQLINTRIMRFLEEV